MSLKIKAPKILDFDIENMPISYYGGDLTLADITAIACSYADDDEVVCAAVGEYTIDVILDWFGMAYHEADIVTGHYIRRHDLPLINGAMVERGLHPLTPKLTIDTKLDLIKWSYETQPKSQEELALTLGIDAPKVHMSQQDWRDANRLTDAGIQKTVERCAGDVRQHKLLRLELTRRGLLSGPKLWSPGR